MKLISDSFDEKMWICFFVTTFYDMRVLLTTKHLASVERFTNLADLNQEVVSFRGGSLSI